MRSPSDELALGHKIFHFNDHQALTIQSNAVCKELYDNLSNVLEHDITHIFGASLKDLASLVGRVKSLTDCYEITWMADYGCAILIHNLDVLSCSVIVTGLDGWRSKVHASVLKGREATSEADIARPTVLFVGTVRRESVKQLLGTLATKMARARSQQNQQKHHWTPSFVWARLLDALVEVGAMSSDQMEAKRGCYEGGTTDVGLHTACLRRNTSFPLVASVYSGMLWLNGDCDHEDFFKVLVVYFLHHLRNIAEETRTYDARRIDSGIIVIREIQRYLFQVNDAAFHKAVILKIKSHHHYFACLKPEVEPNLCSVPQILSISDECKQIVPSFFPDVSKLVVSTELCGSRVSLAKAQAEKNLDWSDLLTYIPSTARTQDAWVALGRLNNLFWQYAEDLHDRKKEHSVESLLRLLAHHSHATKVALKASQNCVHVMSVDLQSCEMLVAWITYCWAHRIAVESHSFFGEFSAALDPQDLQYLALQDADAIDAAEHVRQFLKSHRTKRRFPFRNQQDTLHLASTGGHALPAFKKKYRAELATAEKRIDERYKAIQETQKKLQVLDRDLVSAQQQLRSAESDFAYSEQNDYTFVYNYLKRRVKQFTGAYHESQRKVTEARRLVSDIKSKISRLDKQPPDVFLPLPRSEDKALQWLFFLFMPTEFSDALSLAHLSESKLWSQAPGASSPRQNLFGWFNDYKTFHEHTVSLQKMTLGSSSERRKSPLAKGTNVRSYGRETGVFFPDSYSTQPCWLGTDPFSTKHPHDETTSLFTELLPNYAQKDMQGFLMMMPSKTRGNHGIALKNKKPEWLTHEEYFMFTVLRAFPNTQIRQLLAALERDQLPFEHDCVIVLVKQLLFHVGFPEWKTDLSKGEGYQRLAEQLGGKAMLLQESPNNAGKLLMFGIMSSFLGQFCQECLDCSMEFTRVARALADQVHKEVCNQENVSPQLYWKQAKLYGCAILSHSVRNNAIPSLVELVELIVLYKNKMQFASQVPGSKNLDNAILSIMAKKITGIVAAVSLNKDHLTKCLELIVAGVPSKLDWTMVDYGGGASNAACFEAVADHHYSINVLNGTVLIDGVPPGFLPSTILSDPLYQRTFGSRNFECIVVGVAHYRTSRLVDDRFIYEFKQEGGVLHIIECVKCNAKPLSEKLQGLEHQVVQKSWWPFGTQKSGSQRSSEQTSPGSDGASNGFSDQLLLLPRATLDLPILLAEPYSHWYSSTHDVIFIRDPSYKRRSVSYVLTQTATFRVPIEDASLPTEEIVGKLGEFDRLVVSRPQAVELLGRIEDPKYILVWVRSDNSKLCYFLPRLELEFCQTEAAIESTNFNGFNLRWNQILTDDLPGVTSYLILVDKFDNEKVLFPPGAIRQNGAINVPDRWYFSSRCHIYDVHRRFGHLIANDSVGRLQLAGIYAATSCHILPNMDRATELVRHCWTNEPLSAPVKAKLIEVSSYSNLSCSLRLMCSWIWTCSNRLKFLCEGGSIDTVAKLEPTLELDPLAAREYIENIHAPRLLWSEESLLLGLRQVHHKSYRAVERSNTEETQLFVDKVERRLVEKMLVTKEPSRTNASFPLELHENASGLEKTINNDLLSSWNDHLALKKFDTTRDTTFCNVTLFDVKLTRSVVERELLTILNSGDGSYEMAILSGSIRRAVPWDFLWLATNEAKFKEINPLLSEAAIQTTRTRIVEWMILCVLEDKVQRLIEAQTSHQVLVELKSTREWDPRLHLRWLVFEVEQRLQIRPYQNAIVQQLLDSPESMIQLNMGLGKTSVLVPMLILELSKSRQDVVRINMLASIINVVKDIYKSTLTASVLHVKLFLLPFQRNYPLDEACEKVISEELLRCQDGDSCLLVTPQHRNSLLLKQYDQGIFVQGLKGPFVDVIDESDAILDSSFQLVYALGDQTHLPDGETRWRMMESFLSILSESASSAIAALRHDPSAAHVEACDPGSFPKIRLLAQSPKHEQCVAIALCQELISNPPHEFLWMKRVAKDKMPDLVQIMADRNISAVPAIEADALFKDFQCDILAARGCIAYGMLFHCLRARHQVHYGIDGARKKMAVPFFAADTPKPRADYSHPDVMILYTCLSYFHSGLAKQQLKEALVSLQKLGPTAQETIYSSWLESVWQGPGHDMSKIDSYLKVDIENNAQLEQLHTALSHCMKTISYWMNNCVFPMETHVFPGRRVTSAWNLVDNGKSIGFSGTDDNRFSLPLQVKQIKQNVLELRATNGEMIDRILTCTRDVAMLDDGHHVLWETVLCECSRQGTRALIDVGGLMAGVSNRDVAVHLSSLVDQNDFRGVVYFDTVSQSWHVFQFKGKLHLPLQTSSVQARECFAYYDESRCRGSDLKLQNDACALVTLEPGLTKDRLLQGCARLRQLREGAQSIVLAGTSESITSSSTSKTVLESAIKNTAKRNRKRVMELYERGMDHCKFPAQIDMDVTLPALYSEPLIKHESVSAFFEATIDQEVGLTDEQHELIRHCKEIGAGMSVQVTQLAEECERELEEEEEEEEEEELEAPCERPFPESDWAFQRVFVSRTSWMPNKVLPIRSLATTLLGPPISSIQWSDKLWCTANWRNTVLNMKAFYLRPVNSFLAYPNGTVVLVSDYEADQLLPYWWGAANPSVKLGHLSLANSMIWLSNDEVHLPLEVLTSAKLFCGYVCFTAAERKELKNLFAKLPPRRAILELLQLRHRTRFLDRSDLDVFSLTAD